MSERKPPTSTTTTTRTTLKRLHDDFEAECRARPTARALIVESDDDDDDDDDRTAAATELSFQQLRTVARAAARRVQRAAPAEARRRPVGICCRRGECNVVGMLAALYARRPFVPLDAASPDRLRFVASDAGLAAIFAEDDTLADLERCEVVLPVVKIGIDGGDGDGGGDAAIEDTDDGDEDIDDGVAYILYTSGSTGRPKGVRGSHRAMLNRFEWAYRRYPYHRRGGTTAAGEVAVHKTSLGFVDSIFEILGPLGAGVPLLVPPASAKADPDLLIATLARHRVTRLILVPSLLRAMLSVASPEGEVPGT